jgi:hypothetical protein
MEPGGPTLVARAVPTGGLKAAIRRGARHGVRASDGAAGIAPRSGHMLTVAPTANSFYTSAYTYSV